VLRDATAIYYRSPCSIVWLYAKLEASNKEVLIFGRSLAFFGIRLWRLTSYFCPPCLTRRLCAGALNFSGYEVLLDGRTNPFPWRAMGSHQNWALVSDAVHGPSSCIASTVSKKKLE
jgi:hypothetical protein